MKLGLPVKITSWAAIQSSSFTADGHSILYTSIRDKQADIYRYDIARGYDHPNYEDVGERVFADADARRQINLSRFAWK